MPPPEAVDSPSSDTIGSGRPRSWSYRAFGLSWASTFPLPAAETVTTSEPDVRLEVSEDIDALWSGHAGDPDWLFQIDGRRFVIQRGATGDFRLVQQHGVRFHVDRDARVVSCETAVLADLSCQRLLLDTVLWTTSLLRGREALHASAVRGVSGVVAFLGASGGGKTSLAFELIRRGYTFFCDDVLVVERGEGGFVAHPSPPLMNLPASAALQGIDADQIARLGEECWVAVGSPSTKPSHLDHLFLLHRFEGAVDRRVVSVAATSLDLLPHAQIHAFVDSWERHRFDLCSDLALGVPVSRLEVDLEATPSDVADLVEGVLTRRMDA